jgi:hypothetical protein
VGWRLLATSPLDLGSHFESGTQTGAACQLQLLRLTGTQRAADPVVTEAEHLKGRDRARPRTARADESAVRTQRQLPGQQQREIQHHLAPAKHGETPACTCWGGALL